MSGKKVIIRQEARGKAEKRGLETGEEREKKDSKGQNGEASEDRDMRDASSPGAASSNQAPTAAPSGTEKGTLTETWNEDEAPEKVQKDTEHMCRAGGIR